MSTRAFPGTAPKSNIARKLAHLLKSLREPNVGRRAGLYRSQDLLHDLTVSFETILGVYPEVETFQLSVCNEKH